MFACYNFGKYGIPVGKQILKSLLDLGECNKGHLRLIAFVLGELRSIKQEYFWGHPLNMFRSTAICKFSINVQAINIFIWFYLHSCRKNVVP